MKGSGPLYTVAGERTKGKQASLGVRKEPNDKAKKREYLRHDRE